MSLNMDVNRRCITFYAELTDKIIALLGIDIDLNVAAASEMYKLFT